MMALRDSAKYSRGEIQAWTIDFCWQYYLSILVLILEDKQCEFHLFFFTIEAVYTPNYQLHRAVAQATAHGFEEVKPEPQATPSPATASQSLAS